MKQKIVCYSHPFNQAVSRSFNLDANTEALAREGWTIKQITSVVVQPVADGQSASIVFTLLLEKA